MKFDPEKLIATLVEQVETLSDCEAELEAAEGQEVTNLTVALTLAVNHAEVALDQMADIAQRAGLLEENPHSPEFHGVESD